MFAEKWIPEPYVRRKMKIIIFSFTLEMRSVPAAIVNKFGVVFNFKNNQRKVIIIIIRRIFFFLR